MNETAGDGAGGPHVLVTGATGYIGGRLVGRLLGRGARIRCVARDLGRLDGRRWPGVEIVQGDLADENVAHRALDDIDVAYYLVHSVASGKTFPERDRQIAQIFAAAARRAGVTRIVYLGGLGDPAQVLSDHLTSRQEVGRILAASGVPVIEFRAAVIVGSGSVELRNGPVLDRASAGHDHTAVGGQTLPTDRCPQRPRVPDRGARPS